MRGRTTATSQRILLCGGALCFSVGVHYLAKPARDAYMLQYWGTDNLPWLNACVLILVVVVARAHEWIRRTYGTRVVFPIIAGVTAAVYAATPAIASRSPRLASLVLTMTVGLFNLSGLAAAWSLVDSSFSREEARRIFAWAAVGGPIGGVLGALAAHQLAGNGPRTLLFVSAGVVLAGVLTTVPPSRFVRRDENDRRAFAADQQVNETRLSRGAWKAALALPYARLLLGLALTISGMGAVVKWVFFRIGETGYSTLDARTKYFASSYLSIALLALIAQVVVTPLILRRLGPGRGLQLLPLFTLGMLALAAWMRSAAVLSWSTMIFMAFDYTVNQCSREMLYVPTPIEIRFDAKQYVDTAGRQGGVILGNLIVLGMLAMHAPHSALYATVGMLTAGWFGLASHARLAYRRLIAASATPGRSLS